MFARAGALAGDIAATLGANSTATISALSDMVAEGIAAAPMTRRRCGSVTA
jgi:hypothetical protein